jgi:hypothetical protein
MKTILSTILLLSNFAIACPSGQHDECIIWNPFVNSCAQWVCAPNAPSPQDPFPDPPVSIPGVEEPSYAVKREVQKKAIKTAEEGKKSGAFNNKQACMVFVTGALALWGSELGGPYGAAAGGAMGFAASSLACNQWYGEGDVL